MQRRTHLLVGVSAYLAYTCLLRLLMEIPASALLAGLFSTLIGSVMPDTLEPAGCWSHRGLFHGRRVMRFSGWAFALTAVLGLFQLSLHSLSWSYIASCFFLGYALHLLADSTTPAGIPG